MKISENEGKITNPHFKKVYRLFSKDTNMALADVICLHDEVIDSEEYEIFDPRFTWKRKNLTNFYVEELQKPIFKFHLLKNQESFVSIHYLDFGMK